MRAFVDESKLEFKGFLSFLIMHELAQQPLYGDQLAERIGARRGEKLTPGTIYPALKRLREEKFVAYERDGVRKIYSLTSTGKKELQLLYRLFGRYFKGLKSKIRAVPKKRARRKNTQQKTIKTQKRRSQ